MNDIELKSTKIARRNQLFKNIEDIELTKSYIDGIYFNPLPISTWKSRLGEIKLKYPIGNLKRKIGFYFNDELRLIQRLNDSFGFYLVDHNHSYFRYQDNQDEEWVWKYMSTEQFSVILYAVFNWLSYLKTYMPFKITGDLFSDLLDDLNSDSPLIIINFTKFPIYNKSTDSNILNISLVS